MQEFINAINQYGVPTVTAVGMAYFIFYIWKYVTKTILPSLNGASGTLIALIDRIRMLDNDMIRLNTKIQMILQEKEKKEEEEIKENRRAKSARLRVLESV